MKAPISSAMLRYQSKRNEIEEEVCTCGIWFVKATRRIVSSVLHNMVFAGENKTKILFRI